MLTLTAIVAFAALALAASALILAVILFWHRSGQADEISSLRREVTYLSGRVRRPAPDVTCAPARTPRALKVFRVDAP